MRLVHPAEPGDGAREFDHFGGRRERARHVEEAGAQPERAVAHALLGEADHALNLVGRGFAVRFADHLRANRSLADEAADVQRRRKPVQLLEKRRERDRRRPVRTLHDRRHTLADVVGRGRHLENAASRVRVNVDEPRRGDLSGGIHDTRRRGVDARRDRRDGVAAHRDVAAEPRAAGPVNDARVPEQQVIGRRLRTRGGAREQHGGRCTAEDGEKRAARHAAHVNLIAPP